MALIKCRECGGEVSTQAAACPKCGAKVVDPDASRNGTVGCIALVVVAMLVGLAINSCSDDSTPGSSSAKSPAQIEATRTRDSFDMCKQFITKNLRDPASADFISQYVESAVTKKPELNSYSMVLRVRANNGFGGKTVSDFSCEVMPAKEADSWLLVELKEVN